MARLLSSIHKPKGKKNVIDLFFIHWTPTIAIFFLSLIKKINFQNDWDNWLTYEHIMTVIRNSIPTIAHATQWNSVLWNYEINDAFRNREMYDDYCEMYYDYWNPIVLTLDNGLQNFSLFYFFLRKRFYITIYNRCI